MQFIDHTGHKFSLASYDNYPIGYESTLLPFSFWLKSYNDGRKLSINNWYCLPIWILLDKEENLESIEIHSSKHYIMSYDMLKKKGLNDGSILSDDFHLSEKDILSSWNDSTYYIDSTIYSIDIEEKKVVPLYVFGYSEEEGTFSTNFLLHTNVEYVPVCVSSEWHDENEQLIVNGQNMGFKLPKDILKAMYDTSYFSETADEVLLARKMKEALLQYMSIKGENGNYNSVINSIEWFGYGDKLEFTKLIKTDNSFISQYIHDSFNINNDLLYSYKAFVNSTLISLRIRENKETDDVDTHRWNEEFWGEGKPFVEDLFMKVEEKSYDEKDISFWRPFYDWNFTEMALKLSLLSKYLKKYFLPVHLLVKSATIDRKVFINDTKHIVTSRQLKNEKLIECWDDVNVSFPKDEIYIYNQVHYTDECYNDIDGYEELGKETDETILYFNDACASIPMLFTGSSFYDVNLILTRDGNKVYESKFQFCTQENKGKYNSFILYPKKITRPDIWTKYGMSWWNGKKYRISILCNGKWFYYDFTLRVPELQLGIGTLKYNYFTTYEDVSIQEGEEGYLSYEEWLASNNIDSSNIDEDNVMNDELKEKWEHSMSMLVMKSMFTQIDKITDNEVTFNSFMYIPSLVEVNDIDFYDKLINAMSLENNKSVAMVASYENYLKYLASKTYMYDLGIENAKSIYNYKDPVVPLVKFNDGIGLSNIVNDFSLESFYVDVYFDIDTNNTYYAKVTYTLDELRRSINKNGVLEVKHLKSYAAIDDSLLVQKKYAILNEYPEYYGLGIDRKIDWEMTPLSWRQFYIDDYEATRNQITIRVVWRGKVTGPGNTYYDFGGYDINGNPIDGYFLEQRLETSASNSNYCSMECGNKLCQSLCKFRKENVVDIPKYNQESKLNDAALYDKKITEIQQKTILTNVSKIIKDDTFKYKVPNMPNYLNRVHIYDIYDNEKIMKYDSNLDLEWNDGTYSQDKSIISLYREFFNDDGTQKISFKDSNYEYDFYLMHDDDRWFGIFISKMTINNVSNDDDLEGPATISFSHYRLKKYRSGNRFFINRMMYVDAAPTYKIDKDDIVVCTIDNVNYPYILDKDPKWKVVPYSLGITNIEGIQSIANTMILSIPDDYVRNAKGYYDIKVRYSIDNNVNQQQTKKRRILIY